MFRLHTFETLFGIYLALHTFDVKYELGLESSKSYTSK